MTNSMSLIDTRSDRELAQAGATGSGARRSAEELAIERQAETFNLTRRARQNEIVEDYVELIADLIDTQGEARNVDIGRRLGVTHATVNKTIARLRRDGLVTSKPYRSIFLTDAGRKIAARSKRRHLIVVAFLRVIGVSEKQAGIDAEGIEHYVSDETLAAFARIPGSQPQG